MVKIFSALLIGFFSLFPNQNMIPAQFRNPNVVTIPSPTPVAEASLTGTQKNLNNLPLGDNNYVTDKPKKGYIFLCRVMQGEGGAEGQSPWIHGESWNLNAKPSVNGRILWPIGLFSINTGFNKREISGNGIPVDTQTGIFPIQSSDPVYKYDKNPNTIYPHSFSLSLPENPTVLDSPICIQGEVGIMMNGVPLFNGFDAENRDAPAHEIQDSCDGHPQVNGEYHYHSLSRCMKDIKITTVIGYALDGFPITGPQLSNENYLSTTDLDECHGMTSEILIDGQKKTMYHYVMTYDFPYSVSCFRGKPVRMQVIPNNENHDKTNKQPENIRGQRQLPQEALTACNGKATA